MNSLLHAIMYFFRIDINKEETVLEPSRHFMRFDQDKEKDWLTGADSPVFSVGLSEILSLCYQGKYIINESVLVGIELINPVPE